MSSRVVVTMLVASAAVSAGCSNREDISMPHPGDPRGGTGRVPDGPVVSSTVAPPPIAGGTLFIASDGVTAVVSDPDRDRIVVVDLLDKLVVGEVALQPNDEPGRATEDAAGRVHVALRRGGAIVTVDVTRAAVVNRRAVCAAPRGIAYDAATDLIHVACDTGELVSLGPTAAAPSRVLRLGRDLRDVIVDGDRLLVSRFRSAELHVIGADGTIVRTVGAPRALGSGPLDPFGGTPSSFGQPSTNFAPAVAWRTVPLSGGGVAMLHQGALSTPVQTEVPGGYGGSTQSFDSCSNAIVSTHLTPLDPDSDVPPAPAVPIASAVTAVDMAISPHDARIAIVAAGNNWAPADGQLLMLPPIEDPEQPAMPPGPCQNSQPLAIAGEAIAVAFDGLNRWVVQSREPALLQVQNGDESFTISLGGAARKDTGLALFHMNSGSGIACASCHPEGRDDGHVWSFDPIGPRRTQVPAGGILDTAPFHWSGDMADFKVLVHEVFSERMGGGLPSEPQLKAFGRWLNTMPMPVPSVPANAGAAERGRALFESTQVGCATCHSGAKLTNNESYDVGTGGVFQVPSLVGLAARAPFLHTGCAATLRDRFDPACGGGDQHGVTQSLAPAEIDDLVAYLETL